MKIVLVGYMGSGKSTIGSELANALGFEFSDLDILISDKEEKSILEIFQKKGEIYFRKREAVVLRETLSEKEKIVLALGGGTPCYGTVMKNLLETENVIVIYLKSSLETLTERLFEGKDSRPLISHLETKELLNDFIRKHLFERSYYYNQASIKIDCDNITPQEIVEKIVATLF